MLHVLASRIVFPDRAGTSNEFTEVMVLRDVGSPTTPIRII